MSDNTEIKRPRGNPLWVRHGASPNANGRPKIAKSDHLARLKRWSQRLGTDKELTRIYNALPTDKDRLEMLKAVWFYTLARPQADTLSAEQIDEVFHKAQQIAENASKKAS